MIVAAAVISSVPMIAWYAPPASMPPNTPRMVVLRKYRSNRLTPFEITVHSRLTSGISASMNAEYISVVKRRSFAARPPSTSREMMFSAIANTIVPSTTTSTMLNEPSSDSTPPTTTSVTTKIASGEYLGSFPAVRLWGMSGASGVCTAVISVGPRELRPAADDPPREHVDEKGDHEQHETGEDQHVHAEPGGLGELQRDVRGDVLLLTGLEDEDRVHEARREHQ